MIIKIKALYNWIPWRDPKEAIRIVLAILYTITQLPAFFFHEFSHIFWMIVCTCPFQTRIFYVLRIQRRTLLGFRWTIQFQSMWEWETVLIAIAPLVNWTFYLIASMVFLISNHEWYSLLPFTYGIYARKSFSLSDEDIQTLRKSFAKMRLKKELKTLIVQNPKSENDVRN